MTDKLFCCRHCGVYYRISKPPVVMALLHLTHNHKLRYCVSCRRV